MLRDFIEITLNGKKLQIRGDAVFQPLSSFLRYERLLTGTKVVCAEGDCGACTVMAARWNPKTKEHEAYSGINSCIATTFLLDGANLVTVEGLKADGKPCEVQDSMARNFGGQCGFCTPGFVMAITDLYEKKAQVGEKTVKNYLTGNLCRCTGYEPIVKAALDVDMKKHRRLSERYAPTESATNTPVKIEFDNKIFFAPTNLAMACEFKAENPETMIFSGATDLGVRFNKGHIRPTRFLSLNQIPELHACSVSGDEFKIGAKATLSEFLHLMEREVPQVAKFLNIFASPQIKNSATLIGNLANASPIADTTPVMMALDAVVDLVGLKGARTVALKDFYLGYKKLDLQPDEIITQVRFPRPGSSAIFANYKISQRRDLDISCVNASFYFEMHADVIGRARMSLGGVAPTTIRLLVLEKSLAGKKPSRELLDESKKAIAQMIKPISDARGSAAFRTLMAQNLCEKYFTENFKL